MEQLLNFFTAPYTSASIFDICLEICAAVFGIGSVLYAKKEKIAAYPVGLVSTSIYIYVCFQYTLYGDLIINSYYTIMTLYGWYLWSHNTAEDKLPITVCHRKDWIKVLGIFSSTSILVIGVYLYFDKFGEITAYFDTLTTGIFFAGMWLMANKKLEHWLFWIVGNTISVPLYFVKGLGFSGVQFFIFVVLAIQGYKLWKVSLAKQHGSY